MTPRSTDTSTQDDLFRHRLDNIISLTHPLVRLSERIDWDGMNGLLGDYHEDAVVGLPPKPTRLMAGLLYLKHTFALSDVELIASWVENAYWQYFCGETFFQHEPPIHPTSLTRYRQRLGAAGCEELLALTIDAGVAKRVIEALIGHMKDDGLSCVSYAQIIWISPAHTNMSTCRYESGFFRIDDLIFSMDSRITGPARSRS